MSKGRGFAKENNHQDKSKDSCNDVGHPEAFDFSRLFLNPSICHYFTALAQQQIGFSRKLKVLHFAMKYQHTMRRKDSVRVRGV